MRTNSLISKIILIIAFLTHCNPFIEGNIDPNSELSSLIFLWRITRQSVAISPEPGHYTSSQYITMSALEGSKIYFTTDGSEPSIDSNLYSEPIHIWKLAGAKLKAIAIKGGITIAKTFQEKYYSFPELKTGKNDCYDSSSSLVNCSGTGQDGETQNGLSRTYSGPTQHGTYPNDYTTKDDATGLIWKSCSQGQTGANCTGGAVTLDWTTAQTGVGGCNELNTMNSGAGYAGRTDWRLPSVVELRTLVDYKGTNLNSGIPRINAIAFPNTPTGAGNIGTNWTKTESANGFSPFNVAFSTAFGDNSINQSTSLNVRCVAGFNTSRSFQFTDNGDLTVTDHRTSLIWQKCSNDQSGSNCTGTSGAIQWFNSLSYCNNLNLASKKWRLPSINELTGFLNLLDYNLNPRVDQTNFPNNTTINSYWSSTYATGLPDFKIVVYPDGRISSISFDLSSPPGSVVVIRCVTN